MGSTEWFDRALDALQHSHRRQLLVALRDENPQTVLRFATTIDESTDVETELYHTHVPKLEDYGYVTWDRETDEIMKGPRWDEIEPVIRLFLEHESDLGGTWL